MSIRYLICAFHNHQHPVETISLSAQGAERRNQGRAFLFVLPLQCLDRKNIAFTIDYWEETP